MCKIIVVSAVVENDRPHSLTVMVQLITHVIVHQPTHYEKQLNRQKLVYVFF